VHAPHVEPPVPRRGWAALLALGVSAAAALDASFACEPVTSDRPPLLLEGNVIDGGAPDAWVPPADAGVVSVLAAGVATPTSIALDAVNVYWTDRVGGVWSVPRTGGATSLLTVGQASAVGLVVDGNGYWLASGAKGGGSVVSYSFASGTASTLVTGVAGFYGVAASPAEVFWTAESATGPGVELDEVQVDGGALETLAMVPGAVGGGGLALDVDAAYFAVSLPNGGGSIVRAPLSGGPPVTVWSTVSGSPSDVALGAGAVYWLIPTAMPFGAVWSVSSAAAAAPLIDGLDSPGHLAVDDANAYWTSPGEGQIVSIPLTGGAPVVLAGNLESPLALVVDDAIYFTTVDGVLRLSK
jgi:hypothetical protein